MQAAQALLLPGGEQKTHLPLLMSPARYSGVSPQHLLPRTPNYIRLISSLREYFANWSKASTGCALIEPPHLRLKMYFHFIFFPHKFVHFHSSQIRKVFPAHQNNALQVGPEQPRDYTRQLHTSSTRNYLSTR